MDSIPDKIPEHELEVKEPESGVESQADLLTISEVGEETVESDEKSDKILEEEKIDTSVTDSSVKLKGQFL